MKSKRQGTILELIEQQEIETQEELADLLRRRGMEVTQATVSRDIKELRLIKVLSEQSGRYHYATADKAETGMADRFNRIFADTVLSMVDAYNLIIVKTLAGSAHVAAEAVDTLYMQEIVGTIAGDNTILVIVKRVEDVPAVLERFRMMARHI